MQSRCHGDILLRMSPTGLHRHHTEKIMCNDQFCGIHHSYHFLLQKIRAARKFILAAHHSIITPPEKVTKALYRDKETYNFLAMGATMPRMTLPHIPILFARKVNHLFTSFVLIAKYYTPFLFKSQSFESLCAKKVTIQSIQMLILRYSFQIRFGIAV